MCLFQWGSYDWGDGKNLECDFTRQFVLYDVDGDYDHMEQLSLTLLFDPDDSELAGLGSGELWSGDDFHAWAQDVAGHAVLAVLREKSTPRRRLVHSNV